MTDFMAGMDPFHIFPEEVWVLILDKTDDSQDAWNLLKAFPQLDANVALQKKKRFWLFGLVIPHLIQWRGSSWISEADMKNCRQVCKQWSSTVDGFLESQPQLQDYQPEAQGQVVQLFGSGRNIHWSVDAYLDKRDKYWGPPADFGGTHFDIYPAPTRRGSSLKHFIPEMEAHPPGRTPFLSRMLTLCTWDWERRREDGAEAQEFVDDLLLLHRKFGEHVWFYKLEFLLESLGASCLTKYITYLPNLKLLHLVFGDEEAPSPSDANVKEFVELVEKALPPLPSLETLWLERCPPQFSHFLLGRFAAQIRRLDLHMDLWRDEYSKLFPNLTEFDIWDLAMRPDGEQMKRLLSSLEAPQLSKIQVKYPSVCVEHNELDGTFQVVIEDDVFQWLKRFPKMKFLDMGYCCRFVHSIERGTLDPANDTFSSLRFLAIRTSFEMSYNFLRCLPSLQHLQLYVPSEPFVIDLSTNSVVKILEEIQTASMYKSNIWELLPKLKTVVLLAEEEDQGIPASYQSYPFNRERYEFERRLGNGLSASNCEDYAPATLREDILDFLGFHDNWRRDWFPESDSEEVDEVEVFSAHEGRIDFDNDVEDEEDDEEETSNEED